MTSKVSRLACCESLHARVSLAKSPARLDIDLLAPVKKKTAMLYRVDTLRIPTIFVAVFKRKVFECLILPENIEPKFP